MAIVNMKDSRWLQLEVCREYQRNKCSRPDTECKFAHPPTSVDVQNGRVVACYDSIKGRCNREKPPCKYFHPPQHLKDQLLINGRNHLALKNALMQSQMPHLPILGGQMSQMSVATGSAYHMSVPAAASSAYGPYAPLTLIPGLMSAADQLTNFGAVMHHTPALLSAKSSPPGRADRLEICREFQRGNCKRCPSDCRFAHPPDHVQVDATDGLVTVCMDFVKGRCSREMCRYLHPPAHLQAQLRSRVVAAAAAAAAAGHQPQDFAAQSAQLFPLLPPVTSRPNPYRL